jgi:hypothetical protein
MIEKEDVASDVSRTLQDVYRILAESVWHVNEQCNATEAQNYRQKVGKVFYSLIFDLMEPLYKKHPELKPPEWDDRKNESNAS